MSRTPSRLYVDAEVVESNDMSESEVVNRRTHKLIAFGRYGGKFSRLDWILRLFVEGAPLPRAVRGLRRCAIPFELNEIVNRLENVWWSVPCSACRTRRT